MLKTILTLLTAMALLFSGLTGSHASSLPPCEHEDSTNCYWDATTMGNQRGSSFVDINGVQTYTTPAEAHTCAEGATLTAERQCTFLPQPAPIVESAPIVEPVQVQASTSDLDTQAWNMWDATQAYNLLPSQATTVTFLSHNTVGFPLTADTIIVWDNHGNFYQFGIS